MGASDKQQSSITTRAKEAGKRGLEDVVGAPSLENKKKNAGGKNAGGGRSSGGLRQGEGTTPGGGSVAQNSPDHLHLPLPPEEIEDNRPVNKSTLNNHVALLMDKLNSIEGNTITLNRDVSQIFSKLDDQSTRIKKTETSVENHAQQIGELKRKNLALSQQISELKKRQSSVIEEVDSKVDTKMKSFKEVLRKDNELFRAELINATNKRVERSANHIREDFMEEQSHTRKNNLIIVGLQEAQDGDDDLPLVNSLFSKTMGVTEVKITDLLRLGKPGGTGPRPLLVKFASWADRKKVWYAKSKLKEDQSRKIWLQEDMPKPMKDAQRSLYQSFKKAKSMPETFKSVQLRGTKLILDGEAYGENDLQNLPRALRPQSLATRQSESVVVFFGKASPLSNHHPSPFTLDGHQFNTIEQYLAWRRAKVAGKKALINRALSTTNPVICKGILNELRDDNLPKWEEVLDEVITSGLRAKFKQNDNLAQFLIGTYPKTLGEASFNKRWGIGLPLNSKDVFNTSKWQAGGNLLGEKLTLIREELRP